MSVVEEVKERLDIVEVIGSYVPLQKAGRNFKALCPFHNEKTPSFYVFPESQRWHCFGACGEGGDVFSFVMKQEGWDFRLALEELARRAGVELKPRTPAQVEAEEESQRLRAALAEAALYYHHLLRHAPEAALAREYLAQRGLSEETVECFQLGYSLPGWENLRAHLTGRGFTPGELIRAGLLVKREDGTAYDRFRDRLMIPIRDGRGRPVGFGARTLDPEGVPKYINSPKTPLFDKGRTLFGLDLARQAIREEDQVVIVEGYMDVMQAHQAGFSNVVAQMGTALTEPQVRRLKRSTARFILALDPDAAGVQATLRGLEVAREVLDREWEPVFNPRGLVGFEGRLGAEIRILSLPSGYDPDDLIRSDPGRWAVLVEEAAPVVEFYMQMLLDGADQEDAKERSRVVDAMLPLLRDVADVVERETYSQKLARALGIEARTVLDLLQVAERRAARRVPSVAGPSPQREVPRADLEGYCLKTLLARSWLLERVDQVLEEIDLPPLRPQDFAAPVYRVVFEAWEGLLSNGVVAPEQLLGDLPEAVSDRLESLLEVEHDLADEQWLREGVQAALRLRERNLRRGGAELRALLEEAAEAGRQEEAGYGQALSGNARAILQVQQAMRAHRWAALGSTVDAGEHEGALG
jgi:DNA primase